MIPAIIVAGAALSAYAAYTDAQNKKDLLNQQAEQRKRQGYQAYLAGEREARLTIRRGERLQAAQAGALGQSGSSVTGVSNLMMLEETAANYTEDARMIREDARYKTDTSMLEAGYDQKQARDEEFAGYLGVGSSILGGYSAYNDAVGDAPRRSKYRSSY